MYLVTFQFEEDDPVQVRAMPGENLLTVARRARVALDAPCMGNGSCGKCRVRIMQGNMQSSKSFYIDDVEYREGWRLACTSRVTEDVVLYVK